jgi:hypothetical protein
MTKKSVRYSVVYNTCFGGFGISNKAVDWLLARGSKHVRLYNDPIFGSKGCWEGTRHDPLLIECVRELGEKANGRCAELEIFELDGSQYRIDEYDGNENVEQPTDEQEWVDASDNK